MNDASRTTRCEVLEWHEAGPAGGGRWPVSVRAHLRYDGLLTGEGWLEGQLDEAGEGVRFSGRERVSGSVCGKTGTFAIRHQGRFSDGLARSRWQVEPGSGTEGLEGIAGTGGSRLPVQGVGEISFRPRLPDGTRLHAGPD